MLLLIRTVFYSVAVFGLVYLVLSYAQHQDNFFTRHVKAQQAYARSRLDVTQLNYLIPSFKDIFEFHASQRPLSGDQWQAYSAYYAKINDFIPAYDDAYLFSGLCQYYQGQKDKAYDLFQKALILRPDSFWAKYNLGVMLAQAGDCPGAANILGQALRQKPMHVIGRMRASKVYQDIALTQKNFGDVVEKDIINAYDTSSRLKAVAEGCANGQIQWINELRSKALSVQIQVF